MEFDINKVRIPIELVEAKVAEFYARDFKAKKKSFSIRRDTLVLGSDTSEHGTGIAMVYTDDTHINIVLRTKISIKKGTEQEDALKEFIGYVQVLLAEVDDRMIYCRGKYKHTIIVLEDTFLGFGNPYVLKVLSRFGGIILMALSGLFQDMRIITPTGARSSIGFNSKVRKPTSKKETIKSIVMQHVRDVTGVEFTDNDICDAFVLALTGLME